MKILHVHDFYAPGNSRLGFDMDRLLVELGHTVHVLAGTGSSGPEDGHREEGLLFHTYPYGRGWTPVGRYRYAVRQNARRFEQLHAQYGYDLIVLNQPLCAAGILSAPSAAKVAKVYCFISPWAEEWRIAHPDAGILRRWLEYEPRRRMEVRAMLASQAVMVESRFIESEARRLHPTVPQDRLHLFYGGVDLTRFRPAGNRRSIRASLGFPGGGPMIATMRRLVPRMGIENLLAAVERLPGVVLVIGGEGPLRESLQRAADRPSLRDRVRLIGYVRDEDLPDFYRAADLFVLPTRALEGFGLVTVEAMACGTPAAGTPVGAIPEVLGGLDRRLVFSGTSPDEIADGIGSLLKDPSTLESLGSRCRDYVAGRFDWRKIVLDVERMFREVVERGVPA